MPSANLFPLTVDTGDQIWTLVRFYGTDDYSELWSIAAGAPTVAATAPGLAKQARGMGDRMSDGTRAKWVLEFSDGTRWLATPGGGCGCSNPLRHFKPEKVQREAIPNAS